MTPALLFPLGLAALASVLVPLVIHLARRTEQRPTDFAALRWLRRKPRPRHRPKFDEKLLLATRLLLLALLALILAQPVLIGSGDTRAVVAVVPGAAVPPASDARGIWLAPGFPPLASIAPTGRVPVASLIRELDATLAPAVPLTIVVPRILDGADAERPRVSRPIDWRVVDGVAPAAKPSALAPPVLRYDPAVPGARVMRAAVAAFAAADVGALEKPLPRTPAHLIWFARTLPAGVLRIAESGGNVLVARETSVPAGPATVIWRDEQGIPLVESQPFGRGHLLRFTRTLTQTAIPALSEPEFPHRISALFAPAPEPARVFSADYAPVPGADAPPPPVRDIWPWLAIAAAVVFVAERWLATRSARAAAP